MTNHIKLKRFILLGLVLLTILFIIFLIFGGLFRSDNIADNNESGPLYISNTASLSRILLEKQYSVVYLSLSQSIQDRLGFSTKSASILGQPTVNKVDGSVDFIIKTEGPDKEFKVHIDRNLSFDKIRVSIPDLQYVKTIQVY